MADNALKQMPPKFQEAGKEISVRVLSVDSSKRSLEFTKKDTLMKADAPVYQSYKEVKKGDKVVAVVAAEVEHGYVVKSFGNIKGLLTFEDVKSKLGDGYDVSQFKPGSILKTYVLFKKRDRGLALTLSKKKAKEASEAGGATEADDSISTLEGKLPTEE
jgi:ribosomal protein S1